MVTGSRVACRRIPRRSPSEHGRTVLLLGTLASSWLAGAAKAADERKGGGNERSPLPCADDRECVDREGYGSVCVDGQCREYQDRTDAFEMVGLKQKTEAPPEPFKVLPA